MPTTEGASPAVSADQFCAYLLKANGHRCLLFLAGFLLFVGDSVYLSDPLFVC